MSYDNLNNEACNPRVATGADIANREQLYAVIKVLTELTQQNFPVTANSLFAVASSCLFEEDEKEMNKKTKEYMRECIPRTIDRIRKFEQKSENSNE